MSKALKAHIASFLVNFAFAANFTVAKGVMPQYLSPVCFVFLRVIAGAVLFFIFQSIFIREKIEKKDLRNFALLGLFGVAVNQLLFFIGLAITTPINGAIVMATSPILVLVIAAIILKERITLLKSMGILTGLGGALILILAGTQASAKEASMFGDMLILINATSWSLFLVLVKPYMKRYHPITVMKWTFFFGLLYVAPFGLYDVGDVDWAAIPVKIWWGIAYVLVITTFIAYWLNTYSLNVLSPSVVSFYIYLQPVFATFISLLAGRDALSWTKVISCALIFTGVYLVNRKPKVKSEALN